MDSEKRIGMMTSQWGEYKCFLRTQKDGVTIELHLGETVHFIDRDMAEDISWQIDKLLTDEREAKAND